MLDLLCKCPSKGGGDNRSGKQVVAHSSNLAKLKPIGPKKPNAKKPPDKRPHKGRYAQVTYTDGEDDDTSDSDDVEELIVNKLYQGLDTVTNVIGTEPKLRSDSRVENVRVGGTGDVEVEVAEVELSESGSSGSQIVLPDSPLLDTRLSTVPVDVSDQTSVSEVGMPITQQVSVEDDGQPRQPDSPRVHVCTGGEETVEDFLVIEEDSGEDDAEANEFFIGTDGEEITDATSVGGKFMFCNMVVQLSDTESVVSRNSSTSFQCIGTPARGSVREEIET